MITINPHGSIPGVEDFMIEYSGYTPEVTVGTKFKITTEIKVLTSCEVICYAGSGAEGRGEMGNIPISTTTDRNGNLRILFVVPAYHYAFFRIVGTKKKSAPSMSERTIVQTGVTPDFTTYHQHLGINSPKLDPTRCLSVGGGNEGKILVVNQSGGFSLMDIPVGIELGSFEITHLEGTPMTEEYGLTEENPALLLQPALNDVDILITPSNNADKYKYRLDKLTNEGRWVLLYESDLITPPGQPDSVFTNMDWRQIVGTSTLKLRFTAYSHLSTNSNFRAANNPIYIRITLPE